MTGSSRTRENAGSNVPFLDLASCYQELKSELDAAVRRVMASGRYILGEELEAFEAEFASFCGARHCAGTGNGLDALSLALRACGIGPGDEVLVPANTFIATWLAVSHTGATPVPVEPLPDTFNLDAARIDSAVTPRTRAIIAVHLYGQPAGMEEILAAAARHGLRVIEDAAQAHGATWEGRPAGSLADAAAFSFYPAKNLGAFGDGGAVVTSDPEIADRVRKLRNYGAASKYDHEIPGYNSRLDPVQAALLRVRLRVLPEWNARRRRAACGYFAALPGVTRCILPAVLPAAEPSWHLFVIRHPERDHLQRHLKSLGIETLIHYPTPPHLSGAYAGLGIRAGQLPITEESARTVLSLPIGPHMPAGTIERVAGAIAAFDRTNA